MTSRSAGPPTRRSTRAHYTLLDGLAIRLSLCGWGAVGWGLGHSLLPAVRRAVPCRVRPAATALSKQSWARGVGTTGATRRPSATPRPAAAAASTARRSPTRSRPSSRTGWSATTTTRWRCPMRTTRARRSSRSASSARASSALPLLRLYPCPTLCSVRDFFAALDFTSPHHVCIHHPQPRRHLGLGP